MTQKDYILKYLEEEGSITSYECFIELGIVDLQKGIQLLRKEGYNIADEWILSRNRYGKKIKFKKYSLIKD